MRLVDADEAKKYLYEHLDDLHMIAAQNAIDEMPTIDAQPVKRGRWETKGGVHCTRCGWKPTGRTCDLFTAYCAGCGANMEESDGVD